MPHSWCGTSTVTITLASCPPVGYPPGDRYDKYERDYYERPPRREYEPRERYYEPRERYYEERYHEDR